MLRVESSLKELVERQLTQRRARRGEATRPVTTVKCKALYDLQFRATVEGHSFISDESDAAGGHDAGPAPLRYFLAGVMMCHQVWCVKNSALLGVQLDRLEAEISGFLEGGTGNEKEDEETGRGFARIAYQVMVDSPDTGEKIKSMVDLATRRCPAFVTAARATRIDLTIVHNGFKADERTYGGKHP